MFALLYLIFTLLDVTKYFLYSIGSDRKTSLTYKQNRLLLKYNM